MLPIVVVGHARRQCADHIVHRLNGLGAKDNGVVLHGPGEQLVPLVIVLLGIAAAVLSGERLEDLVDGRVEAGGGDIAVELGRKCLALQLRRRLADDIGLYGIGGDGADRLGGCDDGVALLQDGVGVEVAVVLDGDTGGTAVEDTHVAGHLPGDDVTGGVAVEVDAAALTGETAQIDLAGIGGEAGDIAQSVAVDGGHAVIHAVERTGVDIVGVGDAGDIHVCPAVGDGGADIAHTRNAACIGHLIVGGDC